MTCNYEARKRGLYKLQLITDAKRLCPDVVIVLGEDISRFRNASKELYGYLKSISWNALAERLGFDEVWLDVTDIVEYNLDNLNLLSCQDSFFHLSAQDPLQGFAFDATTHAGHVHPSEVAEPLAKNLSMRLRLGSHLAMYLRLQLEERYGYTCTVGISTSKLLSKLVGSLNKPKGQTTLVAPYDTNVMAFISNYEIGKIPGIGFKMSQMLRESYLHGPADFDKGLVYGATKAPVSVGTIRATTSPQALEALFSGPGYQAGIGSRIWNLLHGCDDTPVKPATLIPKQISLEDSYIRLDTQAQVTGELEMLAAKLILRMRIDLCDEDGITWLAHPRTLRLSTRPRQPIGADGVRPRSFKRLSASAPLPSFVFTVEDAKRLAQRLVNDSLQPLFKRLHPERDGWNLSLMNVAVTNIVHAAGNSSVAVGRDIGAMFRGAEGHVSVVHEQQLDSEAEDIDDGSMVDDEEQLYDVHRRHSNADEDSAPACEVCGMHVPDFARAAHERYHELGD